MVGLVLANADNPSVQVELEIANPAADMSAQIDASFFQTSDRAIIGRATGQRAVNTGALNQKCATKVLLEHRLHHRAAADVADANTEDLLHRPTLAPAPVPSSSNRNASQLDVLVFAPELSAKSGVGEARRQSGHSRQIYETQMADIPSTPANLSIAEATAAIDKLPHPQPF